jgi:CRISPR-associated protein Cas2
MQSSRSVYALYGADGKIRQFINHNQDHVLILDLGNADRVDLRVLSLGKAYAPVSREPIIV